MFSEAKMSILAPILPFILGGILVIFLGLAGVSHHFYNKSLSLEKDLTASQLSSSLMTTAAQNCSNSITAYAKEVNSKSEAVAAAQEQIKVVTKKNKEYATKVLSLTPTSTNICEEASKLGDDYLTKKQKEVK